MDQWKQAYHNQFGSTPEEDMAEHAEEVEAWRVSWQTGYDAGEAWAVGMLTDSPDGAEDEEQAS